MGKNIINIYGLINGYTNRPSIRILGDGKIKYTDLRITCHQGNFRIAEDRRLCENIKANTYLLKDGHNNFTCASTDIDINKVYDLVTDLLNQYFNDFNCSIEVRFKLEDEEEAKMALFEVACGVNGAFFSWDKD